MTMGARVFPSQRTCRAPSKQKDMRRVPGCFPFAGPLDLLSFGRIAAGQPPGQVAPNKHADWRRLRSRHIPSGPNILRGIQRAAQKRIRPGFRQSVSLSSYVKDATCAVGIPAVKSGTALRAFGAGALAAANAAIDAAHLDAGISGCGENRRHGGAWPLESRGTKCPRRAHQAPRPGIQARGPQSAIMATRAYDHAARRFSAEALPVLRLATTSKTTFWPSLRVCIPARSTALTCTKTSLPPSSGWMNP
jgi:hypothetical protein